MGCQEGCHMGCLMEKPTLVPAVQDPQLKKSTKLDLLKMIFFWQHVFITLNDIPTHFSNIY